MRVYYTDDATDLASVVSPYHRRDDDVSDGSITASVDEAASAGVDAYVNQPGLGWVPFWRSKIVPPEEQFAWFQKTYGRAPWGVDKYVAQGGDVVGTALTRCRQRGIAMLVSVRLNDEHGIVFSGKDRAYVAAHLHDASVPGWQQTYPGNMSRIHAEHPEWRIVPGSDKPDDMVWNWAVPEAVAHKTALFGEIPHLYDIDGLELDFMRFPRLYADNVPFDKRARITMGFIAAMRAALDSKRRGRELALRVPCRITGLAPLGIDPARLHAVGVNRLTLSSNTFTSQDVDFEGFRALPGGLSLSIELAQAKHFLGHDPDRWSGDDHLVMSTPEDDLSTAALAQANGFDSSSLFNFDYYRAQYADPAGRPAREPPFSVIRQLKLPDRMCRPYRNWFIGGLYRLDIARTQLPVETKPGQPVQVHVRALRGASNVPDGVLRLCWRGAEDPGFEVQVNGTTLRPLASAPNWLANEAFGAGTALWTLPVNLVKDGENIVNVRGARHGELQFVGLSVPCG